MLALHSILEPGAARAGTGFAAARIRAAASGAALLLLLAHPALAEAPPPRSGSNAPPARFAAEVREVRGRLRQRLTELDDRLLRTGDQPGQRAIAVEIELAKLEAELELLGLQAQRARAAGRDRLATKLGSAIAAIGAHRDRLARGAGAPPLPSAGGAGGQDKR